MDFARWAPSLFSWTEAGHGPAPSLRLLPFGHFSIGDDLHAEDRGIAASTGICRCPEAIVSGLGALGKTNHLLNRHIQDVPERTAAKKGVDIVGRVTNIEFVFEDVSRLPRWRVDEPADIVRTLHVNDEFMRQIGCFPADPWIDVVEENVFFSILLIVFAVGGKNFPVGIRSTLNGPV